MTDFIQKMSIDEIHQMNPLSLAFIGDAVYETFVRERVILMHPLFSSSRLHMACVRYVKASSQSEIMGILEGELTPDEERIYKRGRNTRSNTVPKNARVSDYRRATGFEALIGYTYMTGNRERLEYLLRRSAEIAEKEQSNG